MTTPAPDVYVFISGNRELYGLSTRRDGGNLPCVAEAGSWERRDVIPMMLASLAKYVRNADVAMTNLIMRTIISRASVSYCRKAIAARAEVCQLPSVNTFLTRRSETLSLERNSGMRPGDYREHQIQLTAGRLGLKLVRRKGRGADVYSLRALRQATRVLCKLPDGGYGLVYAHGARWKRASWMRLAEIAQVLAQWRGHVPRAWGEPGPRQARSPIAAGSSVPSSGRRYRQLDLTRSAATSYARSSVTSFHAAIGYRSPSSPCASNR